MATSKNNVYKYKLPHDSISWFSCYILIYNVKGMGTLKLPIVLSPNSLSESISATYDQQVAPGRSAPVISYSNTGARTLNFTMRVSADTLPEGYGKNIDSYVDSIKSLLYPDYSLSGGLIRPPHCKVVLGSIILDGVCTSFSASYTELYTRNGQFMVADIDLGFLEVLQTAPGNVYFITGENEKEEEYVVKASFDQSPTLTLYQNGAIYKSSSAEICPYSQGSNKLGEASYSPVDMCYLGYTLKKGNTELTEGIVFDINTIYEILNNETYKASEANVYYRLTYYLYYNGGIVDGQTKFRYIKIVDYINHEN